MSASPTNSTEYRPKEKKFLTVRSRRQGGNYERHDYPVLRRTISSDAFDRRLGRVFCFVASGLLLMVSMWKLTRLDLNEAQFFFGLLLSLCVPLLLVIVGLVLPIAATAWKQHP
jgi:hypothetical protein